MWDGVVDSSSGISVFDFWLSCLIVSQFSLDLQ